MDVMYERKHPHLNGSIETTVHQRQDSTYTVNIRSNAPHGQELGNCRWRVGYPSPPNIGRGAGGGG